VKQKRSQTISRAIVAALFTATCGLGDIPASIAESVPLYCSKPPSRGLRPDQIAQCEKLKPGSKPKVTEAKKQEEIKAVYPVNLPAALLIEGKQPIIATLSAVDNQKIALVDTKSKKELLMLDSNDIAQWVQGDFSGKQFKGGDAVATMAMYAGAAAVVAATGGLGAPLLLLMGPFAGLSAGNQYVADQRVVVRSINKQTGEIGYVTIQLFGKKESLVVADILTTGTGLKASKKRDDEYLKPIRQTALANQERLLQDEAEKLMAINNRKPWCSRLDLSGKSGDTAKYSATLEAVNRLRKQLLMPEFSQNLAASSSEKWGTYLAERPDMKKWAEANKAAAEKMQKC
jgi:hypothetical protein